MVVPKISLLNQSYSYCVCMVDRIDSTKVITGLISHIKLESIIQYFLIRCLMIKKYGAIINKNV